MLGPGGGGLGLCKRGSHVSKCEAEHRDRKKRRVRGGFDGAKRRRRRCRAVVHPNLQQMTPQMYTTKDETWACDIWL